MVIVVPIVSVIACTSTASSKCKRGRWTCTARHNWIQIELAVNRNEEESTVLDKYSKLNISESLLRTMPSIICKSNRPKNTSRADKALKTTGRVSDKWKSLNLGGKYRQRLCPAFTSKPSSHWHQKDVSLWDWAQCKKCKAVFCIFPIAIGKEQRLLPS